MVLNLLAQLPGRRSRGTGARRGVLVAACAVLATGCGTTTPVAQSSTTSTVLLAHSPRQVSGWVTTTLDNAVSLVRSPLSGSTDAQLLPVAQQFSTACTVAQHELTETTWTGRAQRDQLALNATLSDIEATVTAHAPGFGQPLNGIIAKMSGQLQALNADVSK